MAGYRQPENTIRRIWAIAKSPELALAEDDLYSIIYQETGKQHMRELTKAEIVQVCETLQRRKDAVLRQRRGRRYSDNGTPFTAKQRCKIYALTKVLGWDKQPERLKGYVRKRFGVDSVEWLGYEDCIKVIEALKAMIAREKGRDNSGK